MLRNPIHIYYYSYITARKEEPHSPYIYSCCDFITYTIYKSLCSVRSRVREYHKRIITDLTVDCLYIFPVCYTYTTLYYNAQIVYYCALS